MSKWIDSRVQTPSPSYCQHLPVVYKSSLTNSVRQGIGKWMPKDGYKNGEWIGVYALNMNEQDGEVLYWLDVGPLPNCVDLKTN